MCYSKYWSLIDVSFFASTIRQNVWRSLVILFQPYEVTNTSLLPSPFSAVIRSSASFDLFSFPALSPLTFAQKLSSGFKNRSVRFSSCVCHFSRYPFYFISKAINLFGVTASVNHSLFCKRQTFILQYSAMHFAVNSKSASLSPVAFQKEPISVDLSYILECMQEEQPSDRITLSQLLEVRCSSERCV